MGCFISRLPVIRSLQEANKVNLPDEQGEIHAALKARVMVVKTRQEKILETLDANTARKAYLYVEENARKKHNEALPGLRAKAKRLGFEESAVQDCLDYIRDDAPIIIHIKEATLQKLVLDTHYRSLFETGTSGGNKDKAKRSKWESSLFGGCYDGCRAFLRPKYGCLNLSGDFTGVTPAKRSYGTFVMTLNKNVRYRSTFCHQDSSNSPTSTTLGTSKYYAHVLDKYPDSDLKAALSVSRIRGGPSKCQKYKEVQIHGDIRLDSDIESLSVPGRQCTASPDLKKAVREFQKLTNCNILWWQDDLLGV